MDLYDQAYCHRAAGQPLPLDLAVALMGDGVIVSELEESIDSELEAING